MGAGFRIATAYVSVVADDAGLRESMAAKIKEAAEGLDAKVKLQLDGDDLRQKVQAEVAGASGKNVSVKLGVDGADLREKVDAEVAGAGGQGVKVKLGVDGDHLRSEVEAEVEGARAGEEIKIPVKVDAGDSTEKLAAVEAATTRTHQSGDGLWRDAGGYWRNSAGQFASEAEKTAAGIENVGTKAEGAGGKLSGAGGKADGIKISFSAGAAGMTAMVGAAIALAPALSALPGLLAGAGTAGATMALGFGGIAKALTDHAAAVNSIGQSSAQLAATAQSNAVAIRNSEQSIADAKRAAAQAAYSSAEQIANAEQAVGDAVRQAATAAQSSADAVISAQQRVVSSTYAVGQSQQSLANAEYAALQARRALTMADQDAVNQLNDLKNASADAALGVTGAQLAVEQAIRNNTATSQNSLATELEKKQALLAVAQAQQGLIDAQQRATEATQKTDQANKQAASGGLQSVRDAQHAVQQADQSVESAKHGVTDALQQQADANHALQIAQTAQANQAIASAEAIARANQAEADAYRNAANQQISSTEAVKKAVQSLADTIEQQKLAAAAAAASAGQAWNQFNKDMQKLTPTGQAFVLQLLSMRKYLQELSATAQNTMLPGFSKLLTDLVPMMPIFNTAVGDMGRVIGGLASAFGDLFKSPAFQAAFTTVLQQGVQLVQQFGTGLIGLFKGLVEAAAGAGPIIGAVGTGFQALMSQGIPAFFAGLASGGTGAAQSITAIFQIVSQLLGPIGHLVGALSSALGPVLHALAPLIQTVGTTLLQALLPVLPPLSQALLAIVSVVQALLPLLVPLIQYFAQDFKIALQIVAPLLNILAGFLQANIGWIVPLTRAIIDIAMVVGAWHAAIAILNGVTVVAKGLMEAWKVATMLFTAQGLIATAVMEGWTAATTACSAIMALLNATLLANPIVMVIAAIVALVAAAIYCWNHFAGFRDFIKQMWSDIKGWFDDGVKWVEDHFDGLVKTVEGLPGKFLSGAAHLWDFLAHGMKEGLNGVLDGVNWLIDQINGLTHGISDAWTWAGAPSIAKIPHIPQLATGGLITAGGMAIVGENGPEPVLLPPGAQVISNPDAHRMGLLGGNGSPGAMSSGAQVTINYVGTQHPTPEQRQIMFRDLALAVR